MHPHSRSGAEYGGHNNLHLLTYFLTSPFPVETGGGDPRWESCKRLSFPNAVWTKPWLVYFSTVLGLKKRILKQTRKAKLGLS